MDDIDITEDEPKKEEGGEEEIKTEEKKSKEEEDDDIMEVTDIEFVKPVFPVEDLTVSDSESVADHDEKPDVEEERKEEAEVDVTCVTINDSMEHSLGTVLPLYHVILIFAEFLYLTVSM